MSAHKMGSVAGSPLAGYSHPVSDPINLNNLCSSVKLYYIFNAILSLVKCCAESLLLVIIPDCHYIYVLSQLFLLVAVFPRLLGGSIPAPSLICFGVLYFIILTLAQRYMSIVLNITVRKESDDKAMINISVALLLEGIASDKDLNSKAKIPAALITESAIKQKYPKYLAAVLTVELLLLDSGLLLIVDAPLSGKNLYNTFKRISMELETKNI